MAVKFKRVAPNFVQITQEALDNAKKSNWSKEMIDILTSKRDAQREKNGLPALSN